ncbi:kinetochore protein NDC80 homolog [Mytilus trossulus]|uniref:kinetochore protein NDC80 homolog n=1 Tax=Mytilus trossulus TaxID=6551 RepID=UPI003006203C
MRKSSIGGNRLSSHGSSNSRRSSSVAPLRVRNDNTHNTQHQSRLSSGTSRLSFGRSASSGSGKSPLGKFGMPMGRLSRGSSVGLRGQNCVPKDPRPVSDKLFQRNCIKKLVEFLSEKLYPHSISDKLLQSPTSKDFFRIFEFLYGFLVPKFKLDKKPEEQIPKIFKQIGYPFMISKSQMFALGSPHTWPHILAAVSWLVDLIHSGETLSSSIDTIMFPPDDDFDTKSEKKIEFDYIESTYVAYMRGQDTFEEYDDKLADVLKQKYYGISGGKETLEKENRRLLQELEVLEQDSDKLRSLQEKEHSLKSDIKIFESYINELEIHRQNQEIIYKEAEDSHTNTAAEYDECLHQLQRMKSIYETQEFSSADIDRIKASGMELKRQIDEMENRGANVDQDIWSVEMKLSKEREKFEQSLLQYNKLAQQLKSSDVDFQIGFLDASALERLRDVIKPAVVKCSKQCQDFIIKKTSEKITNLDSLEQLTEYVAECQAEVDSVEKKIKLIDEEINIKKQNYQQEIQIKIQEEEAMQREIMEIQTQWKSSVPDAKKVLVEKEQWAAQKRWEIKKEESQLTDFLRKVVEEVIDHKTKIQERLETMLKDVTTYRKDCEKEK